MFVPLAWLLIIAAVGGVFFIIGKLLLEEPWAILLGMLTALAISAAFTGLIYLITHRHKLIPKRIQESVFAQGLVALKGKICPIIYFEENGDGLL